MAQRSDLASLLSLLDDEDETVAVNAMAELLNREAELGDALAVLQESDHPLLRRRSLQLQAAITLRRRRREFASRLNAPHIDLIDGLIDVHLQWYDNDSRPELVRIWEKFRAEANRCPLRTLENIAYFMRKCGFTARNETTMRPEYYCIGPVLENRCGAVAILAGLALEVAEPEAGLRLVRVLGDFALYDGEGRLLVPEHDWQICAAPGISHCEFWDRRMLLRFAALNLFSCAVNSDSFRYVLTIAQALTGSDTDEPMDYFPYPYYPADDDPEPEKNQDPSL